MARLRQEPAAGVSVPIYRRSAPGILKLEKRSSSAARRLAVSRVLRYRCQFLRHRYQCLLWRVGIDEADGQSLGCAAAAETSHCLHELRLLLARDRRRSRRPATPVEPFPGWPRR